MEFNAETAVKHGVEEAILISNFIYWILKNKANGRHEYATTDPDGVERTRTWTYNSADAFAKLFPFWTPKQIRRILDSLIEQGVIVKNNFNKSSYDRTLWYAFSDESIFLNQSIHFTKSGNGKPETVTPIPNILPDIKPNINTNRKDREHLKALAEELIKQYGEITGNSQNKEQAIKNTSNLIFALSREHRETPEAVTGFLSRCILNYRNSKRYPADVQFVYAPSNFFGRAAYWKDFTEASTTTKAKPQPSNRYREV